MLITIFKYLIQVIKNSVIFVQQKDKDMQDIKIGLKFKLVSTNRTYEVTRTTSVSVFFKDITRTPIWREDKTTFLNKFNLGFEVLS